MQVLSQNIIDTKMADSMLSRENCRSVLDHLRFPYKRDPHKAPFSGTGYREQH